MSKRLFVGIDMGSSAVKMVVIDEQKKIVAHSAVEYAVSQPKPGWVEVDPQCWYEATLEGLEDVFGGIDPALVAGIGVTGQMHTTVFLDDQGQSIRPAIMWNDTRSKDLVPLIRSKIAGREGCAHIEHTLSTGSPAANLYWLKQQEPKHFDRLSAFLIGPDYLVYRLCGQIQTDYCEASTSSLYDIVGQRWSAVMREVVNLDESVYPRIKGSAQVAGTLLPQLAQRLGLGAQTPVIVGTGDNAATAVASGCLSGSFPTISLGTSGIVMYPTDAFKLEQKGKPILFSPDGTSIHRLVQGAVQSTGSSLSWWVQSVLGKSGYDRLDRILADRLEAHSEVLFYPHLTGDKTLYADPELRGAFLGLSAHTSKEDMTMAVLEGICYAFRELAEGMQVAFRDHTSIKVLGGGARSRAWLQTLANVLDCRVDRMAGEVSPAFGVALLAQLGSGHIESFAEITKLQAGSESHFLPQPDAVDRHKAKYGVYQRVHAALKNIFG